MQDATHATVATFRMDLTREVEQREMLQQFIVPNVRSAPGFVSGTWTLDRDSQQSLVLVTFDAVEHARVFADSVRTNARFQHLVGIELVSIEIFDVVAHASVERSVTADDVREVPHDERDGSTLEMWERVVNEHDLRGIDAVRIDDDEWPWIVGVAVMEFIRRDPLESELRDAVFLALSGVPGVVAVVDEDRETWRVAGTSSGVELVRAAASVVDAYLDRTRAEYDSLT